MSEVFRSHELVVPREEAGLRMRHEAVKAGRVSLHWLQYGAPVTMSAPEMGRFYLFQFILGGACEIRHRGRTQVVDCGKSYVVHPSEPLAKTWDSDCRQLIVKVDRDRFERFASREIGVDCRGAAGFRFRHRAGRGRSAHPDRDGESGARGQRRCPATACRIRASARHLDATMMALMLAAFPHRFRDRYDRGFSALRAVSMCTAPRITSARICASRSRSRISCRGVGRQHAVAVQRLPALPGCAADGLREGAAAGAGA
jgi:hypothetical protein